MLRILPLLLVAVLPACGQDPAAPDPLKGQWRCVGQNIDGQEKKGLTGQLILEVAGGKLRQHVPALRTDLQVLRYQVLPGGILQLSPVDDAKVYFFGKFERKGEVLRLVWPGPVIDGRPQPPEDFSPAKGRTVSVWKAFAL